MINPVNVPIRFVVFETFHNYLDGQANAEHFNDDSCCTNCGQKDIAVKEQRAADEKNKDQYPGDKIQTTKGVC